MNLSRSFPEQCSSTLSAHQSHLGGFAVQQYSQDWFVTSRPRLGHGSFLLLCAAWVPEEPGSHTPVCEKSSCCPWLCPPSPLPTRGSGLKQQGSITRDLLTHQNQKKKKKKKKKIKQPS